MRYKNVKMNTEQTKAVLLKVKQEVFYNGS